MPTAGRVRLSICAEPGTDLQVSVVRPTPKRADLSLQVLRKGTRTARLRVTARGNDVHLHDAAWERRVPAARLDADTSFRPGQSAVPAWFSSAWIRAGQTLTSEPIAMPDWAANPGEVVFKLIGTDRAGHAVTAWADGSGQGGP
jgi:hypothetical protein